MRSLDHDLRAFQNFNTTPSHLDLWNTRMLPSPNKRNRKVPFPVSMSQYTHMLMLKVLRSLQQLQIISTIILILMKPTMSCTTQTPRPLPSCWTQSLPHTCTTLWTHKKDQSLLHTCTIL